MYGDATIFLTLDTDICKDCAVSGNGFGAYVCIQCPSSAICIVLCILCTFKVQNNSCKDMR